jgi:hypothetical protein
MNISWGGELACWEVRGCSGRVAVAYSGERYDECSVVRTHVDILINADYLLDT